MSASAGIFLISYIQNLRSILALLEHFAATDMAGLSLLEQTYINFTT